MAQGGGSADSTTKERPPSSSQHYRFRLLYRPIVVILDSLDSFDHPETEPDADGDISLRKITQYQRILLAHTGAEQELTAPISFQSLRAQFLPLDRPNLTTQETDVVKVSLTTAVQLIVDLEKREHAAKLKDDDDSCANSRLASDARADAHLSKVEADGYDSNYETRQSIRRVQAALVGDE